MNARQLAYTKRQIRKDIELFNPVFNDLPILAPYEEFEVEQHLLRRTWVRARVTNLWNGQNLEVAEKLTAVLVRWNKEIAYAQRTLAMKAAFSQDLSVDALHERSQSTKRKAEHIESEDQQHVQAAPSSEDSSFRGAADVFAIAELGEQILLYLDPEDITAACVVDSGVASVVRGSPALRRKLFLSWRTNDEPSLVDIAKWRQTKDDVWSPNPLFCNTGPRGQGEDLNLAFTLPWRFSFTIADDAKHVYDVWYQMERSSDKSLEHCRFDDLLRQKGSMRKLVVRLSPRKSCPLVPFELPDLYKDMLLSDRPTIMPLHLGKEVDGQSSSCDEHKQFRHTQAWLPSGTTLGDVLDYAKLWSEYKIVPAKYGQRFRGITHLDDDGPGQYVRSSQEPIMHKTAFMQLLSSIKPRRAAGDLVARSQVAGSPP